MREDMPIVVASTHSGTTLNEVSVRNYGLTGDEKMKLLALLMGW